MSVIPQTPELPGGLASMGPLPGLCLGAAGDLPDPSPTHAPLTTNHGSAPVSCSSISNIFLTSNVTFPCFEGILS